MKISYTTRDFDSFFEELKNIVITKYQTWTKFSASNFGVLVLELLSTIADQNSFYLNQRINELYLMTVKQRRNAIKILKRMNYKLAGRTAASVDLTFNIKDGGTNPFDIPINANYICKTEDGLYTFETVADGVITTGTNSVIISAKNYISRVENIEFSGIQKNEIILKNNNFIDGSLELYIEGVLWEKQEDDLLESEADDNHYILEQNDELQAIIITGDGINGKVPTGEGTVYYKTGGGKDANDIEPGVIIKLTEGIYDIDGNLVDIEVTNISSPSGGEDEESIDHARKVAPKKKGSKYTIIREEYELHSQEVDGVGRVLAISKNEDVSVSTNVMNLYIVPKGFGLPSADLKNSVKSYLTDPYYGKPIVQTSTVFPMDPIYLIFSIAGMVYRNKNFEITEVKKVVDKALITYFSIDNLDDRNKYTNDFGYYKPKIYLSTIINIITNAKINEIKCVENVSLTTPLIDIPVAQKQYPLLDTDLTGLVVF